MSVKIVKLHKIFSCEYGDSKYTKAYCNQHKGSYEVFTGTTIGNFAFINHYDYSKPNLTFSTDGEKAGTLTLIKNDKYSIGGHRAILKKIDDNTEIDLDYCYYYLKDKLYHRVKKGSVPSIRWNSIKDIELKIPIKPDGTFDIDEQQRLASIYSEIERKKEILLDRAKQIRSLLINIEKENDTKYQEIILENIVDFKNSKTNNSNFTKAFINKHKGNIPVYGASKFENEVGYGYVEDNLNGIRYFNHCLTWNIDGSYAVFYRKGRFSLSEKVIPLKLFDKYNKNICLDYLKYAIMLSSELSKFDFNNKGGKGRFKKIMVNIPVKPNGDFDLEKQIEIADKNKQIDEIKQKLIEKIENLISISVRKKC